MNELRLHDVVRARCPLLGPALYVWVQGCPRRCAGCFNSAALEQRGGRPTTPAEVAALALAQPGGLVLSGGEPFAQSDALAEVCERVRADRPEVEILAYTGYRLEELLTGEVASARQLLGLIDVVIDGPFELDRLTDEALAGSDNQRVIVLSKRIDAARIAVARRPRLHVSLRGGRLQVDGTGGRAERLHRVLGRVSRSARAAGLIVDIDGADRG